MGDTLDKLVFCGLPVSILATFDGKKAPEVALGNNGYDDGGFTVPALHQAWIEWDPQRGALIASPGNNLPFKEGRVERPQITGQEGFAFSCFGLAAEKQLK